MTDYTDPPAPTKLCVTCKNCDTTQRTGGRLLYNCTVAGMLCGSARAEGQWCGPDGAQWAAA